MKKNRCPYCGKRLSYFSAFHVRRKAEFVCTRCGKESRVVQKKAVWIACAVCILISVGVMLGWIFAGLSENLFGIVLAVIPMMIFTFLSPVFVSIEPLKKYEKSMEAKKAGIEYSDNLIMSEFNDEPQSSSFRDTDKFQINSDLFNKIRDDRNASRTAMTNGTDISSSTSKIYAGKGSKPSAENAESDSEYVHVIDNVSETHAFDNSPLKKINSNHSNGGRRIRHYIPDEAPPAKKDENKYSSNRKF